MAVEEEVVVEGEAGGEEGRGGRTVAWGVGAGAAQLACSTPSAVLDLL